MVKELLGKPVALAKQDVLKKALASVENKGGKVTLAIVLVGDDHGSSLYAKFMKRTAEGVGMQASIHALPATATEKEVMAVVSSLNQDPSIHGILPMMPLPAHISAETVIQHITPDKDVDGLTVSNIGLVQSGRDGFWPCTPLACQAILEYYKIPVAGKRVVVLGRSNVIGRPVAMLLLQDNGTVTICHSRTKNLADVVREADIVVAAIGRAQFVTADMIKPGAVVIDVGINELDGQTVGDVDYDAVSTVASAITPVPGGVGSVTTTMMLEAVYKAYLRQKECGHHA